MDCQMENNTENADQKAPANNSTIRIIYPPPHLRSCIDTTAKFVANKGPEFELIIREKKSGDVKFNFLNQTDPYNAYYRNKIKEFKNENTGTEIPKSVTSSIPEKTKPPITHKNTKPSIIIKDPPAEFEFSVESPLLPTCDLDIVKLTAQFVARNGRQFLSNLMQREQRNYQFDFLRPQHHLFNYFTKLLEQYTKVMAPSKNIQNRLKTDIGDTKSILDQVRYRVEWIKLEEAEIKRERDAAERERLAYAEIDWHDFVIADTVDYQQDEYGEFPPPTTPEEVGALVLGQERYHHLESEMVIDSDEDEIESGETLEIPGETIEIQNIVKNEPIKIDEQIKIKQPIPLPPIPDLVEIRKDYDPKAPKTVRKAPIDDYLISPITGEKILASKLQEHMRYAMLDPRWLEQQNKNISMKSQQDQVFADNSAIESSLRKLAERRTDIFGVGDEETAIGEVISLNNEETGSIEEEIRNKYEIIVKATTSAVAKPATQKVMVERPIMNPVMALYNEPMVQNFAVPQPQHLPQFVPPFGVTPVMAPHAMMVPQGFLGGIPPMQPVLPPQMPALMLPIQVMEVEPPAKRQKIEGLLIGEDDFLRKARGPVTIRVLVPNITDKEEWQLNGQVICISMPLTDMISVMKAKIYQEIHLPPGKQKLLYNGMFFKDSNTLAYYNLVSGSEIQLQLKERGGRKK